MYRRERPPRHDEPVYEVRYTHTPPPPRNSNAAWVIAGIVISIFLFSFVFSLFRRTVAPYQTRPSYTYRPSTPSVPQPQTTEAYAGDPKIDLSSIEKALWETKPQNASDFKGWMQAFEDKANAIYFASLKAQNPTANPATLMTIPLRVEAKREPANDPKGLLHLVGYIDKNGTPGYQAPTPSPTATAPGQATSPGIAPLPSSPMKAESPTTPAPNLPQNPDISAPKTTAPLPSAPSSVTAAPAVVQTTDPKADQMIFTFKQQAPYNPEQPKIQYALYDGDGYFYREPSYAHTIAPNVEPAFLGFFTEPAVWGVPYYRTSFVWFGTPGWYAAPMFFGMYISYYSGYFAYRSIYATTYHTRYRPWGWSRGTYFVNRGGRYYYGPGTTPRVHRSGYRSSYGGYRSSPSYGGYRSSPSYGGYRSSGGSYRSSGGKY